MTRDASRTASFLRNSFWSIILILVNTVSGFIVPRVVIGCYGSSANGLVNSITQLVSYITLVEAGIGAAAIFALYKPLAEGDKELVDAIVTAAKTFYYRSGIIFTVLIGGLAVFYPMLVNVPGMGAADVAILVLSLGATGFLDFFTLAKYQVLLTASQQNWVVQIASIIYKLIYVAIVIVLTFMGMGLVLVYVVAIGAIVLRSVILIAFTRKAFPGVTFTSVRKYRLEQHWDAFFLQILGAVQSGAPVLIATFLLNDLTIVSVYSIYQLVATAIQSIGAAFSNGTQASFGDVIAKGQKGTLKRSFSEFQTSLYALNGFLCGMAFALIVPFVGLYASGITDANYIRPSIGFLCVLNVFLWQLKTPQGLLVTSAGHYRQTRIQTTMQTVILIVASISLGWFFGIEGIIAGACLSNLYRDIDLMFYVPKWITETNVADTAVKMVLSCLIAALIAIPYTQFCPSLCATWGEWLLHAAVLGCWGVAVALCVCIVFEREDMESLRLRMKRMLKGRLLR